MVESGLPFGVNLPIRFLKDDALLRFGCDSDIRFVTTSAGSPAKFIAPLRAASIVVYHVVPAPETALKCVDAGVDGLVVRAPRAAASRTRSRSARRYCCGRSVSASRCR